MASASTPLPITLTQISSSDNRTDSKDAANDDFQEPYSVFNPLERRFFVCMASFSAMFSGLSSFIYYPAVPELAVSLKTSIFWINLSITAYLVVAGLAPCILGDLADQMGRRPVSLIAFMLYFAANLGLAFQDNYVALIVLRCLQSAGSSGTIAIAYGVISDITTPRERGTYVGILLGFTNSAPCLGPVIGGIIAQELSWRWIFWLLAILSGLHLLNLLVFFPETSRKLVGNGGSPPPHWINRSLYSLFKKANRKEASLSSVPKPLNHIPNPLSSLKMLCQKGTFIIIAAGSIQYTIYSSLGTSLSTEMARLYALNHLTAGLIFLPSGVGGILAATLTGKLLDHDYRIILTNLQLPLPQDPNDILAFPVEKTRLRFVFLFLTIASISTVGYGWSMNAGTNISVPLAMQFLSGASQVAVFVICGTLLTDLNLKRSATAQASYNIVRCSLAAAGIAAMQPMIAALGVGWCFTVYTGMGLLCVPLLLALRHWGWGWRKGKGLVQLEC